MEPEGEQHNILLTATLCNSHRHRRKHTHTHTHIHTYISLKAKKLKGNAVTQATLDQLRPNYVPVAAQLRPSYGQVTAQLRTSYEPMCDRSSPNPLQLYLYLSAVALGWHR